MIVYVDTVADEAAWQAIAKLVVTRLERAGFVVDWPIYLRHLTWNKRRAP
ncbi:MAG: hypothetical protein NT062_08735 [Proteobacteria bacterium]|nr:hypothetical protein [Pseudomonadota bacterium]